MEIFRKGQGNVARISAIAFMALIGVLLAGWSDTLISDESVLRNRLFGLDFVGISVSWAHIIAAAVFCICIIAGLAMANTPKVATFLIDTESEVKKVSWSTYKELMSSTGVVIMASFFVALFVGVADLLISKLIHLLIHL
ncbi:MAG: preprotein translocase subunit SecE [Candidatus Aureabacteria bacterium]|nr:preprotein translocase subunit SecE [Candidatus Auribacterota bacterium]